MPFIPLPPSPSIEIPRSTTFTGEPAVTIMPLVPATRTDPKVPVQSIVMLLVIVTAPKPPGSRQSISPDVAVLEMAPANVLQGAVRLQGLASSPTPDTQVREACACAGAPASRTAKIMPKT